MKKSILTILFFACSTIVFAQNNPVDFEENGFGADWTWDVFENDSNPALEIIENPDKSGGNTSDQVAKFTATANGMEYAGFTSNGVGTFTLDETNRTIKIMVWKSVISDVGIKLEAAGGWSEGEIKVPNTVTNQWEELTFDFSNANNPPADQGGEFAKLTIFPDFASRSEDNIVYLDNVVFSEGGSTGEGGGDAVTYCNETVTHLGISAETASAINLSIYNVDAQSMRVEIESADSDPVDVLIVNNLTGPITGSPAVSPVDTTEGTLGTTLTWNETPPAEIELNILWSKESFEGNWQLGSENTTVEFTQSCDGGSSGGGELVTNGDFETSEDDSWYGNALNIRSEGDNSYNFVDVESSGNAYDVNLSQLVTLSTGGAYVLKFDASSAGNGRTMVVGIGQSAAPYYADVQTVTLADTMQSFMLELDAVDNTTSDPFGGADSRVIFDMGADTGIVVLDNISLMAAVVNSVEDENVKPDNFVLNQNYPNPFNPSTNISFNLPLSSKVTLEVFNIQGQKVATLVNGLRSAGNHIVSFNASKLSSGVYLYRLSAGNSIQVKKMLLIK